MKASRKSSGSMMVLVTLSIGLIVLVAVIGITFNNLLFQNSRSQDKVDALAMSMAGTINGGNRVGQINETVDRCRELVYVSRQMAQACSPLEMDYMSGLCDQLLTDARAGQKLVENERWNQIHLIRDALQNEAIRYNTDRDRKAAFALQWIQVYEPRVVGLAVGTIKDVQSSVRCQRVFPGLMNHDYTAGYFDTTSGLYAANLDAKLPGSDADLDFYYTALPASMYTTISPPRNTNSDVFIQYGNLFENGQAVSNGIDRIPNAVQVVCSMDAAVGPDRSSRAAVNVVSTAITSGASPESR